MRYFASLALVLAISLGNTSAADKEQPAKKPGVLVVLEKGMPVSLKESGSGYVIGYLPDLKVNSHKVIEVGVDYVVVEDIAGITQTRIPIYSIKAVTVTKIEVKKGR